MHKLQLPFVKLPTEFVTLLKSNLPSTSGSEAVFKNIRSNQGLYNVLEKAFKEFDDGRGVEKLMLALGWPNFRERIGSLYVFKSINGDFPQKTDMELVEEIKKLEARFSDQAVHSYARIFLLGFYLKLANIQVQNRSQNQFLEFKVPLELDSIIKLSQGRTEKIDWLILIVWHLYLALGGPMLTNSLIGEKKFSDLYVLMSVEDRKEMLENLLAYGASIEEPEVFLYEKI